MVTMAEVSAITRGEYLGSEQQVDYATLTHCAYIGGSGGGVSMLYGSGDQVPRRWDSTNKSQATLVEGFWERNKSMTFVKNPTYREAYYPNEWNPEDEALAEAAAPDPSVQPS